MKTLARMSFWISSDETGDFEVAFGRQLAPLLRRHELTASDSPYPGPIEGICTHWFEDHTPDLLSDKHRRHLKDPDFQRIMLDWGRVFGDGR